MVNLPKFFDSLLASWIPRIQEADPDTSSWVQLPKNVLSSININGLGLTFNFDEKVLFTEVQNLPCFYREVVKCYNKAFVTDKKSFEESILRQPLWGNKYITKNNGKTKNVLFLRNWIRSGIMKVGDLKFLNGFLDLNYTCRIIHNKQNIYCEVLSVKKALSPFQQKIKELKNNPLKTIKLIKSKEFYNIFKKQVTNEMINVHTSNFLSHLCSKEQEIHAFTQKVVLEKETKLKEFNFKLLHGILPCNENLKKWKISLFDSCDMCGQTQSIEHLLYNCVYVKPLWQVVDKVFQLNINFGQILGIDTHFNHHPITTIVCFLIYKQWLLLSLENKHRAQNSLLPYVKAEMLLRLRIYKLCSNIHRNSIQNLEKLLVHL